MPADGHKRKTKKPKSNVVRVIAVRRLPSEGVPETILARRSPYVTDNGYADFFEGLASILSSIDGQPATWGDERKRAIQEAQEYITTQMPPESPELAVVALSRLQEGLYQGVYKQTKNNPLYAIDAFVAFHHLGLYPPLWVLDWLNTAFLSFIEAKGEKSLDSLLGVTPKKGQVTKWQQMGAIETEAKIMQEIATLNSIGISVAAAAAMVVVRLEAAKISCPIPETLAERYVKRGWSKAFKWPKSGPTTISPEARKRILAAYPKDAIPAKIR